MNYIKNSFSSFAFSGDVVQVFQNKFTANAAMEKEIVRKKMSGELTAEDVRLADFTHEHTFVTYDMLVRLANVQPQDLDNFKKKVDRLILFRIFNRFILADDEKLRDFPEDALYIYCLDIGGKYLLDHYSKTNMSVWNTGTAGMCPEKISRLLVAADFHVKLIDSCKPKIKEFCCRSYRVGKDVANLSFELKLETFQKSTGQVVDRYFIGDVIRRVDGEVDFRDRLEILNSICSTKIWTRFWKNSENPPIVLFIAEDEEMALEIGQTLQMYKIPKFFITTDSRIKDGIDRETGIWLTYSTELQCLQEAKTKMFMANK